MMIGVNNVMPNDFNETFINGLVEINLLTNLFKSLNLTVNAVRQLDILEWIPYNRLTDIKYLDKGGFSTVYKATWLDGHIKEWNYENQQWSRNDNWKVVLKSLDNSSNLNNEFLSEVIILFFYIL